MATSLGKERSIGHPPERFALGPLHWPFPLLGTPSLTAPPHLLRVLSPSSLSHRVCPDRPSYARWLFQTTLFTFQGAHVARSVIFLLSVSLSGTWDTRVGPWIDRVCPDGACPSCVVLGHLPPSRLCPGVSPARAS